MPKFRVTATMYTYLETVVEAENSAEAYRIAKEEMDGADFTECPKSGDWGIENVALIND